MNITKSFETKTDKHKEIHINIEDAHFTLLADSGIEKLGCGTNNNPVPLHFHSFYEIFYIRDGSMELKFENSCEEFLKNNLVISSPYVLHSSALKNESSSRYCINFFIQKNNLKSEHSLYNTFTEILPKGHVCIKNASSVYESIKKLSENIVYGNHFKISFYFYEFILSLMNITGHLKPASPEELLADSSISRTHKIQHIISSEYMNDISLEYIAKSLYLSTRQVNRIVQSFYGCTYREVITRTRIKVAAEFLSTSTMTVSEISLKVGYRSLRGFYSAFKKHYGCLPTEYRKNMNGTALH